MVKKVFKSYDLPRPLLDIPPSALFFSVFSLCTFKTLNEQLSASAHAEVCNCPTLGIPLDIVKPIAPAWYIGLLFMQTCEPATISDCAVDGLCLRHLARYFSHRRLRWANGNTPLGKIRTSIIHHIMTRCCANVFQLFYIITQYRVEQWNKSHFFTLLSTENYSFFNNPC